MSKAKATLDEATRKAVMRNHTSAHLLQAALREVLGNHVHQSGSYVDSERMRFDFTFERPMTKEEIEMDLKSLTNNFTKKEGSLKCGYEEEKISAVEILKKHYNIVEASGDDRNNDFWYVIEYAEPKTMEESVRVGYENFSYAVINPDGTFAGAPCKSYEEARELASQKEGRVIVDLVDHLDESVECKESNAFSDGTYTVIDAGSSWKIKDGNGNWLDVEFENDKEATEYIDELQKKESLKESKSLLKL